MQFPPHGALDSSFANLLSNNHTSSSFTHFKVPHKQTNIFKISSAHFSLSALQISQGTGSHFLQGTLLHAFSHYQAYPESVRAQQLHKILPSRSLYKPLPRGFVLKITPLTVPDRTPGLFTCPIYRKKKWVKIGSAPYFQVRWRWA